MWLRKDDCMAFDFYFAGSQCQETTDLIKDLDANVLKSFYNDMSDILKWFEYKKQGWKGKLLIDNGAFTVHRQGGEIKIDSYIEWLNSNDSMIDYAIALDHIPGKWGERKTEEQVKQAPIKTWENYLYMIDRCKSPQKLLPVFHQGEDYKYLKQIVEHKINDKFVQYICISGNKELTNKQREDFYLHCFDVISKSNNQNIKTHFLGSATLSNAKRFPVTSMDATSWIMTGANGSIFTDWGNVKISKESKKDKDNIVNLPKNVQQSISDYCKKHNITLEQAQDSYRYRMVLNIYYLYEQSKKISYNNRSLTVKKLF